MSNDESEKKDDSTKLKEEIKKDKIAKKEE